MIGDIERKKAAESLLQAERDRKVVPLLTETWPGLDLEDAYAIQNHWLTARLAAGARVIGHKIGLTSRAMQVTSKLDEPDYGHLLDDMVYHDGDKIALERFAWPRIEVELAFVLGRRLQGPSVTLFDVLNATDYVVPAIELIDYRTVHPRTIFDTVADNGAAGAVISGGRAVRPMDIDLRWIGATLSKNGVIEESGMSAAVMGHPAMGVAWLANKLAPHGGFLDAGHFILAGSFTRPIEVHPGDTVHADYGPLGAIGVSFR